jgi:hypothetical protein
MLQKRYWRRLKPAWGTALSTQDTEYLMRTHGKVLDWTLFLKRRRGLAQRKGRSKRVLDVG